MNALLQEIRDPRRRFEADLAQRLEALFKLRPALCGFAVQEFSPIPSHVVCHPALDCEEAQAVLSEIAEMLLDLVDEQPESAELLHGRTFARMLH